MSIADVLMQLQRLQWEIYEAIKPGVVTAEAMREATSQLGEAVKAVQQLSQELKRLSLATPRHLRRLGYQTTRHPIWGVDSAGVLRKILTSPNGNLDVNITGVLTSPPAGKSITKLEFVYDPDKDIEKIQFYEDAELLFTLNFVYDVVKNLISIERG